MLKDLLIHEATRLQIDLYLKNPAHALLLGGPAGSGKKTIAQAIASKLLGVDTAALDSYPYYSHVRLEEKTEISIDQIRRLINSMKLKTLGKDPLRRVVLIENAEGMSLEAQNALLKMLEEPSGDTAFILTALASSKVLPTIASRAQQIHIQTVPLPEVMDYFAMSYPPPTIESNWRLSQGAVGLLSALLKEDSNHSLSLAVAQSKNFLKQDSYNRLLYLESISKSKLETGIFFEALQRIVGALHYQAVQSGSRKKAAALLEDRKLLNQTQAALGQNVTTKLISLKLVMNLRI